MILVSVIVGYILGIAPFITPKIIEFINKSKEVEQEQVESKEQNEIFDEWLNGPKKDITQEDIYQEYITGKVVKGD